MITSKITFKKILTKETLLVSDPYNKACFTLGVRAEKTWANFEHFLLVVWPQVTNKC
jgi:hypothetical protein